MSGSALHLYPLAVWSALMFCWVHAPVGHAAGPASKPGIPQSCGVQLKTHNFTVEVLDKVHALGFRAVRRGFYWHSVEKEKGVYDFSDYDAQMEHARKLELTVVGVLFAGNELYEDDGQGGIQTEAGRKGFAAFAAALAEHYEGHDVLWEIWNEPNVRTFWRKNGQHNSDEFAAEYTDLVKAVVPAMLEADPDCFIVAGSVSCYWEPSYEWTESCFKRGILATGIRAWSVHPYGVKTPEESADGHKRMRELLRKYGADQMALLNTERGFAVKEAPEGWPGGSKERAREFQAWNLVRQYMVDQLHGVPLTVWYEWDGEEFGITDEGDSRPAYTACRVMVEQLDGWRLVRRVESDSDLDYVLLFEDTGGGRKLVAWTAPPPGGAPEEAREHFVAVETNRAFDVVDLDGTTQAVRGAIPLRLDGAPRYVVVPPHVELGKCATLRTETGSGALEPAAPPHGSVDLRLLEPGVEWEFIKNTGEGSFELGKDDAGKSIGILHYDFTQSRSRSTPYVLASAATHIASGAQELRIHARSPIAQQLTFRIVDQTGQIHQYKKRITGTGQWEAVRIPLTRRLEHWGGAADGKIHFPITQVLFSLPLPDEEHKTGKVEYADVIVVMPGEPQARPAAEPTDEAEAEVTSLEGPTDLQLFQDDAEWRFQRNTGAGSFELGRDDDGRPIGIMHYDFMNSRARSTPYVLAAADTHIAHGATEVRISARSPIPQRLTFRVVDQTGQTLQFKGKISGTGDWETIRIPLTRKLEHWDGADDGRPHFPITKIVFCVPLPGEDHKSGTVEYAEVIAQ